MRALFWFRSDLRTRDNTALSLATHRADRGVVALFVIAPGQWRRHDYAPVRVDLILRTLAELSKDLAKLNIALHVTTAESIRQVSQAVLAAAREHACDTIFFNKEYELDESRRDAALLAAAAAERIGTFPCTDQVLAEPGDIRTGQDKPYTVFSPFRRSLYQFLAERGGVRQAAAPRPPAEMIGRPSPVPAAVDGFRSAIDPALWPAGETHAIARLQAFAKRAIHAYKDRRDFPATGGTSALSPYLTIGAISPRQCLLAARAADLPARPASPDPQARQPGVASWISEVVWREFYIHVMAAFPRVCTGRAFQPATEALRWNDNPAHAKAWADGRTGIPIVDAGMRQLAATGWMHNRVRMIVAMFLSKNLFLDWRIGERWFMRHLVDGFLASNNGGWQWSASTGTDAAPYFRIFNPISQSQKFDPDGDYIRTYVPELAGLDGGIIHKPWNSPLAMLHTGYPAPVVDLAASRQRAIDAFRALRGDDDPPLPASPDD